VDALDFQIRNESVIDSCFYSLCQFDQPSLGLASRDYYVCTGPYEEVKLRVKKEQVDFQKLNCWFFLPGSPICISFLLEKQSLLNCSDTNCLLS